MPAEPLAGEWRGDGCPEVIAAREPFFLAPFSSTLLLRSSSSLSGAAGVRRYFLMRSYAVTSHSRMDLREETELKRSLRLSFRSRGSLAAAAAR